MTVLPGPLNKRAEPGWMIRLYRKSGAVIGNRGRGIAAPRPALGAQRVPGPGTLQRIWTVCQASVNGLRPIQTRLRVRWNRRNIIIEAVQVIGVAIRLGGAIDILGSFLDHLFQLVLCAVN